MNYDQNSPVLAVAISWVTSQYLIEKVLWLILLYRKRMINSNTIPLSITLEHCLGIDQAHTLFPSHAIPWQDDPKVQTFISQSYTQEYKVQVGPIFVKSWHKCSSVAGDLYSRVNESAITILHASIWWLLNQGFAFLVPEIVTERRLCHIILQNADKHVMIQQKSIHFVNKSSIAF